MLEQWLDQVADKRELRQRREMQDARFTQEREHLQRLPDTDFDTSCFNIRHVAWDGYIDVCGYRYSEPEAWCVQPVSIRITLDDELRISVHEQRVASHLLSNGASVSQAVAEYHEPLWQQVNQVEHCPWGLMRSYCDA